MKFFGCRQTRKSSETAEKPRKKEEKTRKIADSENCLADTVRCGRSPCGRSALRTPIYKRGRVALRKRFICPPLVLIINMSLPYCTI